MKDIRETVDDIVRRYKGTHEAVDLDSVGGVLDSLDRRVVDIYPRLDFLKIDAVSKAAKDARQTWRRRLGAREAAANRALKRSP